MSEKEFSKGNVFFYNVLKGILSSLVITGLSLLIISVIYLSCDLTETLSKNLVTAASLFSVFISSLIIARKINKRGLLLGILIGVGYAVCLYITGFLAFGFPGLSKGFFSLLALLSLLGGIAGVLGVNIKGKK